MFARRCAPSATVRNRPPPFATVRNRSREVAMAVPLASSAKVVSFGGFKRRVGGVALCDLPICLVTYVTCPKPFCVTGAIFLCRFQKMTFIFRRNTLATSIVTLHGKRSTLEIFRAFFFANRIVRAASSGDNMQLAWQAWHFVTCDEN